MGQGSQGADRREALHLAWQEIHEIEAGYFLHELWKSAPPKPNQRRHWQPPFWLWISVLGILVAMAIVAVDGGPGPPAEVNKTNQIPAAPAPPSYCDPRILPGGDNAARALRDCPQFAGFRAEQAQLQYEGCLHGQVIKPVWSGLFDSPPDPTC